MCHYLGFGGQIMTNEGTRPWLMENFIKFVSLKKHAPYGH